MSALIKPIASIPKQQRAVETRQRLLDATVACLVAHGYSGASTTLIARRAGVSQGALYKHFPAKHLLLGAATERVLAKLRSGFGRAWAARASVSDPLEAVVDVLWSIFLDPRLDGVFEMYLAARTDTALRESLQPVVREHMAAIVDIAGAMFPSKAAINPRFESVVHSVVMTMQGTALMTRVMPAQADRSLEHGFIVRILRSELGEVDLAALYGDPS